MSIARESPPSSVTTLSYTVTVLFCVFSSFSSAMGFEVRGVLAPVFTPFTDSGSVDLSLIPGYVVHLNKHRVTGILGGTTGEGMSLSLEERKSLLEAWINAARRFGIQVVAQVGGTSLPNVLELAKHAEKFGADGIMTLPELYYKPRTVDQLVCYLQRVSEAAPTLPLIYYHFPMMTGVDVNMRQLFSEASSKMPKFKGAKADLGVADQVADVLGKNQEIFIANHNIAPSVLMGHNSSIATVNNIFPDLVHSIVETMLDENVSTARYLQQKLNRLVAAIVSQGDFVPAMKATMELVTGINLGQPRFPLVPLNCEQRQSLRESLTNLDVELHTTSD